MNSRCNNPNNKHFKDYGKRGIAICDQWKSFENFIKDMGKCPKNHSLDRIDNNKGYEPSNCRWASASQQATNKRNVVKIEHNGELVPAVYLAKLNGIKRSAFSMRVSKYGWSVYDAATKVK